MYEDRFVTTPFDCPAMAVCIRQVAWQTDAREYFMTRAHSTTATDFSHKTKTSCYRQTLTALRHAVNPVNSAYINQPPAWHQLATLTELLYDRTTAGSPQTNPNPLSPTGGGPHGVKRPPIVVKDPIGVKGPHRCEQVKGLYKTIA